MCPKGLWSTDNLHNRIEKLRTCIGRRVKRKESVKEKMLCSFHSFSRNEYLKTSCIYPRTALCKVVIHSKIYLQGLEMCITYTFFFPLKWKASLSVVRMVHLPLQKCDRSVPSSLISQTDAPSSHKTEKK